LPIFNNCHLSSVIIESVKIARPARNQRKVIFEGRKLRIRGLEITVRSNSAILCWKRLQIGGENLEHGEKCRTFALSIDGAARAMKARFQMAESRQRKTQSIMRDKAVSGGPMQIVAS